mmetsp:Transcript_64855/g.143209  ORF Transcript_64855/g.143209 Transcript_64855/m.143209 type:complete len:144 (+) Transcript_64855:84-515(+)
MRCHRVALQSWIPEAARRRPRSEQGHQRRGSTGVLKSTPKRRRQVWESALTELPRLSFVFWRDSCRELPALSLVSSRSRWEAAAVADAAPQPAVVAAAPPRDPAAARPRPDEKRAAIHRLRGRSFDGATGEGTVGFEDSPVFI